MIFPKNTRPNKAIKDALKKSIKEAFKKEPFIYDAGNKEIEIIDQTQNDEPRGVYIRITKLGSREPWCMSDGNISFNEYEITYLLDVRISQTEQKGPDKPITNVSIKSHQNYPGNNIKLRDTGEISENVVDALIEMFSYDSEWRNYFSRYGIHNVRVRDERENYDGNKYSNPLVLVINAYVET